VLLQELRLDQTFAAARLELEVVIVEMRLNEVLRQWGSLD